MAQARGKLHPMDYALYSYQVRTGEKQVLPSQERRAKKEGEIPPLKQTFTIEVSEELFEKTKAEKSICLRDFIAYRFIDEGDTLLVKTQNEQAVYEVKEVFVGIDYQKDGQDFSPVSLSEVLYLYHFSADEAQSKQAEKAYEHSPRLLLLSLI